MSKLNLILGGVASMLFITFVSINLIVNQSFQSNGKVQINLTELAAKAAICSSEVSCPLGYNTSGGDGGDRVCCAATGLGTGYKD